MKIKNADELISFLRKNTYTSFKLDDVIYLNKYLYNLLIEQDWDCPLGTNLKKARANGLTIIKD